MDLNRLILSLLIRRGEKYLTLSQHFGIFGVIPREALVLLELLGVLLFPHICTNTLMIGMSTKNHRFGETGRCFGMNRSAFDCLKTGLTSMNVLICQLASGASSNEVIP